MITQIHPYDGIYSNNKYEEYAKIHKWIMINVIEARFFIFCEIRA